MTKSLNPNDRVMVGRIEENIEANKYLTDKDRLMD